MQSMNYNKHKYTQGEKILGYYYIYYKHIKYSLKFVL